MSFVAVLKFLFFASSGGIVFRSFVDENHTTLAAKIAATIIFLVSAIAFTPVLMKMMGDDIEMERLYWTSIEKHPTRVLYCDYLKKYPQGLFADIALSQCSAQVSPAAPAAPLVKPAAAVIAESKPAIVAPPAKAEDPVPTAVSTEDWKMIDRYQVNEGLVRDTTTGLIWMRCCLGQNWDGSSCKGKPATYTWKEALRVPKNFSYAGYDNWRLPTRDELKHLIYCSSGLPTKWDNNKGPSCEGDYAKPTLISEAFPQSPNDVWATSANIGELEAWSGNFDTGSIMMYGFDFYGYSYAVRLVRTTE